MYVESPFFQQHAHAENNTKLPINIFQALSQKDISKFLEREGRDPRNFRVTGGAPLGRAFRVET